MPQASGLWHHFLTYQISGITEQHKKKNKCNLKVVPPQKNEKKKNVEVRG